ncbi:MAG: hypothetical protein R2939_19935 [Kofleriaceae bacterium]
MTPRARAAWALAVAVGAGSCAGASRPTASPTSEGSALHPADVLGPDPAAARAEIQALTDDTSANLARLGVSIDDGTAPAMPMTDGAVAPATRVCEAPPADETCGDVCRLADHICDNGARICDLAAQLPGDDWAADRCQAGHQACATAEARCCGCE